MVLVMKITQDEAYEFMKGLPKSLTVEQINAHKQPLQVHLDPRNGRVYLSFNKKGDLSVPITVNVFYSNGVRKPLQVSALYIWQVVNEGIQRYYSQHKRTQSLTLAGYQLLLTYVIPASDAVVDGVKDLPTKGYVFLNTEEDVISLFSTDGVITAWDDKQPIDVSDPQTQYRLKQVIQQQDRGDTLLDDLLAEEMNNFGF